MLALIEEGARLVTLTGPGGSGKTRLALEAASTLVPEYKAGVFWVGLAALRDPALVTETIAQTLGAKDGLAEHIGERELLLLLDNLEQVIEAAPELSSLLAGLPQPHPPRHEPRAPARAGRGRVPGAPLAAAGGRLPLLRALPARAERGDRRALRAVSTILPLAVELAAARTKALSPAQILERLSQRLDLLKGGRDADPRQQTLRATIEWSYDLLSRGGAAPLPRASPSSPAAARWKPQRRSRDADLDTLQSLVEKSLLRFTRRALLDARDDPGVRGGAAQG